MSAVPEGAIKQITSPTIAGIETINYNCIRYTEDNADGLSIPVEDVPLHILPLIARQGQCTTSVNNLLVIW